MKTINKLIIWVLAIVFASQSIAWTAPFISPQSTVHSPQSIYIPGQYGRVENSVNCKPVTVNSPKQPQVILVKDAHCNYEAQKNIAKILDILIHDYKIDLVCVEGASGIVNPSPIAAHSNNTEIRKKVTAKYLKTGLLTASEALSIDKGIEPGFTIFGVENLRLYLKDYQAFRHTVKTNAETKYFIELLLKLIAQLKEKLYPENLLQFDSEINKYEINEIPLTNFIKFLTLIKPASEKEYPTLNIVIKSIMLEERIYFEKVEEERSTLIKHLEKQLSKEDLRELIMQSLLFKLDKISQADYYSYLEEYFNAYKEGLTSPLENLAKYFELVRLQAQIDETELFRELEKLEESIYAYFIPNETAQKLHELYKDVKILNKILNLESGREDFIYYKANRHKFIPIKLTQFITIQAPINNITLPPELTDSSFLEKVKTALLPSEEFYDFALGRDHALVKNLLKTMDKHKKDNAVLILGGFHAEGARRMLRDKGIDPIVITPSITKPQEDSRELYLARMMDERVNPEMLLAKLGQENIQAPLASSDIGYAKGLPNPIIATLEELKKRLPYGVMLEVSTLDEFRNKIWPLLKEIYIQEGAPQYIRSLIEKAVSDYNELVTEELALILPQLPVPTVEEKFFSDPELWKLVFPEESTAPEKPTARSWKEIEEDLEASNWYWRVLDCDAKAKVRERIESLQWVVEFFKKESIYGKENRIQSIHVKGSFIWGVETIPGFKPEEYNPKDIDVLLIVKGERDKLVRKYPISPDYRSKFGSYWQCDTFEATIIGENELEKPDKIVRDRIVSVKCSGVRMAGHDYTPGIPPAKHVLAKAMDIVEATGIEFAKYRKVFRKSRNIAVQNRIYTEGLGHFYTEYDPNTNTQRRTLEEEYLGKGYDDITLLREAWAFKKYSAGILKDIDLHAIRVIKRIIEANLILQFVMHNSGQRPHTPPLDIRDLPQLENIKVSVNDFLLRGVTKKSLAQVSTLKVRKIMERLIKEITCLSYHFDESKEQAYMESIIVPSKYYSTEIERNGVSGVDGIKNAVRDNQSPITKPDMETSGWETQAGAEKMPILDKELVENLGMESQEFLAILSAALARAKEYEGADIKNLSTELFIALLTKSPRIAENHISDGFIGINAYAIELYKDITHILDKDVANNFMQWLIEHELIHELTGKGKEIDDNLTERDAERFFELFGKNINIILNLLDTSYEFSEWINYHCYKDTTTKSFGILNRAKYEEDLVRALEQGDTTVQVAYLKIQNFKDEFNTRGEMLGIGHTLGDIAIPVIGIALQESLNRELKKYGINATVYNQGPVFYVIFHNTRNSKTVIKLLKKLLRKNSKFKQEIISRIKGRINKELDNFTTENFNIYGGISKRMEAVPREQEEAKSAADTLDIQAIETGKYAQLTIDKDIASSYIEILARATSIMGERRIEEERQEIDSAFVELLERSRTVRNSNIEQYGETNKERVRVSKAYILNREYLSFHTPILESYVSDKTYESLFKEYREALLEKDFEKIRSIKQEIARRATSYKSEHTKNVPIYNGNQRFKDTINYIIRNKPRTNLKLTFRIGGDEYGALIWDAGTKNLRILRFDGNNIGATTFQCGREIGDKVIDEQLRIIEETEDVSKIPEEMIKFFNNMGNSGLVLSKDLYDQLASRGLTDDYFNTQKEMPILIKIPDVLVTYAGKTFKTRPIASIGEVVIDTNLIPEDELDKDYSIIQGRADTSADEAKHEIKKYQSENNGEIDARLAYRIAPAFEKKNIRTFREYTPVIAYSEIAEFIVKSAEAIAAAKEIKNILNENGIMDIEDTEIFSAILKGLEGKERINIMELLRLAKLKGLSPEKIFDLAIKITKPLDRLLDKEAKERGDEVIEKILEKIVEKIPKGIKEKGESTRDVFINSIRHVLENLGITTEEINSELELIEMGLHIIAFDPLLDITSIDSGYFDYVTQVSEMTGVKRDTVVNAFTQEYFVKQVEQLAKDRLGDEQCRIIMDGIMLEELKLSDAAEKLLFRKIPSDNYKRIQKIALKNREYFNGATRVEIPGSKFNTATERLKLYKTLKNKSNVSLSAIKQNNLDFPNGVVRNECVRYLSTEEVVKNDLDKAFTAIRNLPIGSDVPIQYEQPVFLSMPSMQFILELLVNEKGIIAVQHNPGLLAFVSKMKQTNTNFKLGLRADNKDKKFNYKDIKYTEKELLEIILEQNPELAKYLVIQEETDDLLGLRNDISNNFKIQKQNVVIITGEEYKPTDAINDAIRNDGLKIFGVQKGSSFHAALLFGVFYGLIDKAIVDGKLSETILLALSSLGVKDAEIQRIREEGLLFFTVKLTRIEETLREYEMRKIFIEVAA